MRPAEPRSTDTWLDPLRDAGIAAWSFDPASGHATLSPGFAAALGLPPTCDAVDAFVACLHPEDRDRLRSAIDRAIAERREYAVEVRAARGDGDWIWLEARGQAAEAPDGTWVVRGAWIDGTERKRAEEGLLRHSEEIGRLYDAARRLSSTLDLASLFRAFRELVCDTLTCDGLVVSEVDWERRKIRCAFAWVGGRELDPASLPELDYDPARPGMQTEVIRTGESRRFDDVGARARRPGGRFYEVDASGEARPIRPEDEAPPKTQAAVMVPIKVGARVSHVVQVMADREHAYGPDVLEIVESLAAPLAVAVQNAFLYADAERAQSALRRSVDQLEEADRHRNAFLATLAHELRNPLAPIRNAVEVLRSGRAEEAELRWCREVIDRQTVHMARLLDDLLDVSRVTRNRLELRRERVTLAAVIDSALETSRPALDTGQHGLTVALPETPVWLHADLVRLAQVFSNLLNNAAKYTDPGGRIALSAAVEGDEVVVSIRDTGIGIAPEMLPRLFEIFAQAAPESSRAQAGLGIGLSLVRGLVELHGGRVDAHSDGPGRGSEFRVRLPVLAAGAEREPAARVASAPATTGARVLVVDDLQDSADSLAKLLELSGYEVRAAYGGAEAVREAASFRPDVILLDVGMPGVDGYEAARRIRATPWGAEMVLVALTGWGQPADREHTRAAGFAHHLVKPVDFTALRELLEASRRATVERGAERG